MMFRSLRTIIREYGWKSCAWAVVCAVIVAAVIAGGVFAVALVALRSHASDSWGLLLLAGAILLVRAMLYELYAWASAGAIDLLRMRWRRTRATLNRKMIRWALRMNRIYLSSRIYDVALGMTILTLTLALYNCSPSIYRRVFGGLVAECYGFGSVILAGIVLAIELLLIIVPKLMRAYRFVMTDGNPV